MQAERIILLFGIQGSGKGTQAGLLQDRYGFIHLSSGEALRSIANQDSQLGNEVRAFLDRGELVPDEMMVQIMRQQIRQDDARGGVILDGYPRTLRQAQQLVGQVLLDFPVNAITIFELELAEEDLWERLENRISCQNCGAIFNEKTNPPMVVGVCDRCGSEELQKRSDDQQLAAVRKRVHLYHEQTEPLLHYLSEKFPENIRHVKANRSIESIHMEIVELLRLGESTQRDTA